MKMTAEKTPAAALCQSAGALDPFRKRLFPVSPHADGQ
jgi:hypothetical protein